MCPERRLKSGGVSLRFSATQEPGQAERVSGGRRGREEAGTFVEVVQGFGVRPAELALLPLEA